MLRRRALQDLLKWERPRRTLDNLVLDLAVDVGSMLIVSNDSVPP
jgi:hypothetical protein